MIKGTLFSVLAACSLVLTAMPGDARAADLRVATYNIAANKNPDVAKISTLLGQYNIDVAGIQEVDKNTRRNNLDMLQGFVNPQYSHIYFGPAIDFEGGQYGLGIVSRYELSEPAVTRLDSTGTEEQRIYQRVVFKKGDRQIAFYNTHLSFESTDIRDRQLRQLKAAVDADPVKYKIIAGDFNVDQRHDELDLFLENYHLANGKDGKWLDTFNGKDDTMKVMSVDNIIVSNNMNLDNVTMVESNLSDHNMLFVDITFED